MPNIVKLFVNRDKQTAGFKKILDGQTPKRVMVIEAPGGLGKSWTLEYMRLECERRKIPAVEIDFADGVIYDLLTMLRRARDSFGAEPFNPFTQTINELAQPTLRLEAAPVSAAINVGDNAAFSGSTVAIGDVGTVIKDSSFVINADSPVVRQAIQDRLTTAFFECLAALTSSGPLCFFFDTYDKVTVEADSWLLAQLLPRLRDGRLHNVVVVIAGRTTPRLEESWGALVARTGLDLLTLEHVSEYLLERCGLKTIEPNVVQALFQACTGQPQLLALLAENLSRSQAQENDDDWL